MNTKPPRAWWPKNKDMYKVHSLSWKNGEIDGVVATDGTLFFAHCLPILLWPTGLQDNTQWRQLSAEEREEWRATGNKPEDWQGREIYEGDVVRIRMAERDEQTHYGENIPRPDGKYTEPLEAVVREVIAPVIFRDGMFTIEHIPIEDSGYWPLSVWIDNWAHYETVGDMVKAFEGGWNIPVRWDDEEEGDLQYLLSEYKLKSEAELLAYLGVEVLGNIYQHPGLLKKE